MAEHAPTATVFGGTGFLGHRIVRKLANNGWHVRVAVRHPERVQSTDTVSGVRADVHDERTVAAALDGVSAVVNAVSLYVEKGRRGPSYQSVHVDGAGRVARVASDSGVGRVVHMSGIGADPDSLSRFISARGRGEQAVRSAFADATVIRPSVMFGNDDAFFNRLADILARSPVFPLIGGKTRLQPVFADDVADAIAGALDRDAGRGETFEFGGPDVLTMREIVEWLRDTLGVRRAIVPVPMGIALVQARLFELLPSPPLTTAQVELMCKDNVASPDRPGLESLGIRPHAIADVVPAYVVRG